MSKEHQHQPAHLEMKSDSLGSPSKEEPLLELKSLQTHFFSDEGTARAVDGVSYKILPGETLGVVGESGSGKSVLLRMMNGLALPDTGTVRLFGQDLAKISERARRYNVCKLWFNFIYPFWDNPK